MDVIVFGTHSCPNCKVVTNYLDSVDVQYTYKVIGEDIDKPSVDELVGRSVRSVPVIVSNGSEVTFERLQRQVTLKESSESLTSLEL